MILTGAPITEIQHKLGHANPGITLRVYSHFFKDNETDATDRLADAVLGEHQVGTGHRPMRRIA